MFSISHVNSEYWKVFLAHDRSDHVANISRFAQSQSLLVSGTLIVSFQLCTESRFGVSDDYELRMEFRDRNIETPDISQDHFTVSDLIAIFLALATQLVPKSGAC